MLKVYWDPQVNPHSSTLFFKLSYRNCSTMASSNQKSSSSTSIHKYTFEVLLSFRGEDTHYIFIDHLCETFTTRKLGDSRKPLVRVVKKRDQRFCIAALCAIMLHTVTINHVEKVFWDMGMLGKYRLVFPKLTNVSINVNSIPTMNSNFQRKYQTNL